MPIGHSLVVALARVLPPTSHPMVLHFPIALLCICAPVDVLALVLPDRDRYLQRSGFWILTLANISTVAAIATGQIAEQTAHLTPHFLAVLALHQHFAALTGAAEGGAWLVRVFSRYPRGGGWSLLRTRRGRGGLLSTLLVVAAAVLVAITGHYGGLLVYQGGAGVSLAPPA